jgi:branched-chain amino acid transport system ATP-binding protein
MLTVNNIDVFYGDLQALWDVSLQVKDGEIVTIVGSNGAGKSTIMKSLSGLIKPKSGNISFQGMNINSLPAHKIVEMGIAMVPEGRKIFPQMTVLENLEVGATVKAARAVRGSTVNSIYEVFPVLGNRRKQKAGTLSGGEQQMLAIGRALMSLPRLLLIDEMSLGLSPLLVQEISESIAQLNRQKALAILLVEQDVNLALAMAGRGYIIENGKIESEGLAHDLLCSTKVKEAYLGIATGEET